MRAGVQCISANRTVEEAVRVNPILAAKIDKIATQQVGSV
jgi:hypothetical protein